MIHLDTTFLVDLLREARKGAGPATAFLRSIETQKLTISLHALCELHAGAELSNDPLREKQAIQRICGALRIFYPDDSFAPLYGHVLATLQRAGRTIATMDLLIATGAMAESASLVTRNLKHFAPIPGLDVVSY